jgi:hypothetical protein
METLQRAQLRVPARRFGQILFDHRPRARIAEFAVNEQILNAAARASTTIRSNNPTTVFLTIFTGFCYYHCVFRQYFQVFQRRPTLFNHPGAGSARIGKVNRSER